VAGKTAKVINQTPFFPSITVSSLIGYKSRVTSTLARFLIMVFLLAALGVSTNAQAYIDPGTGSLILQGIIAAVAGVAVTVGVYWDRLKTFIRWRGKRGSDADNDGRNVTKHSHGKQSGDDG